MGILLHNVTTAMGDPDLMGDALMVPLRACAEAYQHIFSVLDPRLDMFGKIRECAERSFEFLGAAILGIPAIIFASIGAGLKLVDLYRKFDEKVSKVSRVSDYIPPILKPFSRTGDRMVAYLRARIVADETGMDVHYQPFKGSEIFAFDKLEEQNKGSRYYRQIVYLNTNEEIESLKSVDKTQSILYLVPFAPFNRKLDRESDSCSYPKYQPDWTQYKDRLKQLLHVCCQKFPEKEGNPYTIALHVRDGGDYDDNNTKTLHPLKLPPLNFYTNQLTQVLQTKQNEGQNTFLVHIFTDAVNPKDITRRIRKAIERTNVSVKFHYKEKPTLLGDAGNMDQFQCMIRADSNLSGPIVAASETELDIFPSGFDIQGNQIIISEVTWNNKTFKNQTTYSTNYPKPMKGWLPHWFNRFFYQYFGVHQVPLVNH